ncbi:hypothetical protein H696_01169 [Fonticula alba]|uniref:Uncharacterized protein n=1 Tax=Fonticula alba TaxID=691883 RepID=A0A058ZE59_FONAL|nr:hypothetical protein H696_01169 [Fonticula alba]KCV71747.1 hypothetical protein H696_01169 [Fonticula alba]|eukprot:XP_009493325.1 hypothetical protein H696_01169 [Fonticula alba]
MNFGLARKIAVPGFVPYTTRKGPILLSGFTPDDRARALHRPVVFASQSGSAHQLLADQIFGQPTSLGRVPVSPPTVFPPREAASYPDEDVPLPVTTRAVASSSVHGHRLAPIFAVGAGLADYGVLSCRDLDLANAYLARAGAMAGLLGMCEQTDRSVGGHLALSSGRVILPAHATEHDTMLVRDWAERQNATLTEAMLRHFDSMYPAPAGTSATNSATLAPGSRPLSPVAWAGVPAAVAAWWLPHAERLLAAAAGHPEAVAVFQPRFVPAAVLIPHYRHWTLTGMVALFSSLLYLFIMAVVVMIMVRVLRYSLRQFRGAVAARTGR